jgi:hypothetical protein
VENIENLGAADAGKKIFVAARKATTSCGKPARKSAAYRKSNKRNRAVYLDIHVPSRNDYPKARDFIR